MASDGDRGGGLVCVTGGSGFIGNWLVRRLLSAAATPCTPPSRTSVRDMLSALAEDEGETKHLQALDGAGPRLRLFQMDLLDPASMRPAVEGARGVFHLASPKELVEPAVKGTLSVLRAAKDCGVGRVVMVSSQTTMVPKSQVASRQGRRRGLLGRHGHPQETPEKAAWDFAEKQGLQLAVLNPALVLGPTLTPSITASLQVFLQIMEGKRFDMDEYFHGCVDVRDVAQSLVALYEDSSAQGRHLCLESAERMVDFTNKLADLYPELPVQRIREDKQEWVDRAKDPSKKFIKLGVHFIPFDKTITDTVDCFRSKGLI
ncbi:Cinnamoyl-CoA reductase 1 [Dichanthelium oligosanthes]|uniref:Cinnamoyl-CoA reductase 1 n=1 Tax=Dichanthelium oligosanthes TaxID=888268 RepID=A0A1E5V8W9_9POAL|nr:Cinnamoyl-CoA reductase 1 [Dichanthelium oligosanthes]